MISTEGKRILSQFGKNGFFCFFYNIERIMGLPGNMCCGDCGEKLNKDIGWASLNLGIVLCIKCAGIHRAMGTHISKIRSFRLDTNAWTDEVVRTFEKVGGNEKVNARVWEALLPSYWINPKWDKCERIREHFIRMKYQKKMFLPPDPAKINPCVCKMPFQVLQGYVDWKSTDSKKWTTQQWAVLHSRFFF
ncbi:hypothetical protein RFI_06620 [Reticulomyxa filosa]|uniref:Arf-GAP domain-containing protein n=1 Tax=Reticulomyxa filosa TaxID=46433 RepID=X6NW24_RETFI|nr:hypothetical protein RFI_06620 [Reticulomyxa filosa]|eukprot:ETO30500.1 hypothetical protein RFI_06620 [Reticulomyxa filosa]